MGFQIFNYFLLPHAPFGAKGLYLIVWWSFPFANAKDSRNVFFSYVELRSETNRSKPIVSPLFPEGEKNWVYETLGMPTRA
jgi:hypothetical protein